MKAPGQYILTLNGGSSSIKFALFTAAGAFSRVMEGAIDRIGSPNSAFTVKGPAGADKISQPVKALDHTAAIGILMGWIGEQAARFPLAGVGHRIVHGGPDYITPQLLTPAMLADLRALTSFDPQHLPEEIGLAEAMQRRFADLRQVACFDTAFHNDMPRLAKLTALPRKYEAQGLRRYGFHGLSYVFLMGELVRLEGTEVAKGRIILAHLGNGASLAAVRDGKPVDTSMSFTPASGVMMGTRTGDVDPGLASWLARTQNTSSAEFDQIVNFQSGLLGMSETSAIWKPCWQRRRRMCARRRPLRCSVIRSRNASEPVRLRLAGWINWCSPAASASMHPLSVLGYAKDWRFLALKLTNSVTPPMPP